MKAFASQADLKPKKISFQRLSTSAYAFTAEGDPNTGVIVGDDGVMVIDAQATPLMAREVIRRIRRVTAKPVKYVVLSHYTRCACSARPPIKPSRSSPAAGRSA
jgi:alkyl sulfatase BDS1-like metallo-beta-lactamase superfamily hydrolase